MGMVYKLNAYFAHWDIYFDDTSLLLKFFAMALATVEFVLGIYLLLGIRRRFTLVSTFFVLLVMTGLTVYVYLYNPVSDCGCFGEALVLSNSETLVKNIILLCACAYVLHSWRYVRRFISERNQWLTSIYSLGYVIVLGLYSLHYLPVLDFTAYQKGTDLRAAWTGEAVGNVPEELLTLTLFDWNGQDDVTESVLCDTGYVFLLTLPEVRLADDGCNDRINDIVDECQDHGVRFYGVVGDGTDSLVLNDWIDRTGAAYDYLLCDAVQLKAMVRSNPGLLLLKNGVLVNKWGNNNLPVLSGDSSIEEKDGLFSPAVRLLMWFFIPLALIVVLDGIWIARKYYKHYIFKKTLNKEL